MMTKIFLVVFGLFTSCLVLAVEAETDNQIEQINITRLESLRSECLIRNSGNQKICRRKVLKQCRDMMEKRQCLELMSKMQKSKMPKTNGPGLI